VLARISIESVRNAVEDDVAGVAEHSLAGEHDALVAEFAATAGQLERGLLRLWRVSEV
jgi:hypothetical protein